MSYKIQKYPPEYLKSLTNLLDKCFTIKNEDKLGLINWELSHKLLEQKSITYIALDESDNVVGQYTNLPIQVVYKDIVFKAMVCVDMATDPEHRGRGLISMLSDRVYKDVEDAGYDFTIGFSNDAGVKVDKNSSGYGYKVVDKFANYYKLLVYRKNVFGKLVHTKHITLTYNNNLLDNYFKISKDVDFLNWRYLQKPNHQYKIYKISLDKTDAGLVVLRFSHTKCYVVDLITNNLGEDKLDRVQQCIENEAIDLGSRIIVYHVLDNKYWQSHLNRYKYFKNTNIKNNYYLTIKFHKNLKEQDLLLDKENWLLNNGDIL